MESEKLWTIMNKMDQTLDNPNSILSKDAVIDAMKQHIKEIKVYLNDKKSKNDETHNGGQNSVQRNKANAHSTSMEEISKNWQTCDCDEKNCQTCLAERAAVRALDVWSDVQWGKVQMSQTPNHSTTPVHCEIDKCFMETSENTEKSESSSELQPSSRPYSAETVHRRTGSQLQEDESRQSTAAHLDDSEIQKVTILQDISAQQTGITSKIAYRLHPSLSASGLNGQPGHPHACAVISVLLADRMLKASPKVIVSDFYYTSYLTDEVFQMILSSITEGIDIYLANYGSATSPKKLSPKETMLLNSHLGRSLKDDVDLDVHYTRQIMATYMMNMKFGEILLFYKMENYKVISIICREGGRSLYIFDCQRHTTLDPDTKEVQENGAFVYEVLKEHVAVAGWMNIFEYNTGIISGPCKMAVLK